MSSIARNRLTQIANTALPKHTKPKPYLQEFAKKKKWNILRGDKVQVIGRYHPEKGKQGIVKEVYRKKGRLIVEGLNMANKVYKGDKDKGIPGRTVRKERTIKYCEVQLVDPALGVPTRIFRKILESGEKVRVSKKSGEIVPKPEILKLRHRPLNRTVTPSCTSEDDDVWEVSWTETPPPLDPRRQIGADRKYYLKNRKF